MLRSYRVWTGALTLTLAVLTAAPARADVAKYLPNDTELLLTVNVRQILDAPLVKNNNQIEQVKGLIKGNEDVQKVLEALGFDLFKDLTSITIALPAGTDLQQGTVLVEGKFNA